MYIIARVLRRRARAFFYERTGVNMKVYLKNHLNFIVEKDSGVISCSKPGELGQRIEIEVEDVSKIWDYLMLISNPSYSKQDIENWLTMYGVDMIEKQDVDNFLIENNLVYTSYDKSEKNSRMLNFFNNIISSNDRYEINQRLSKEKFVVVIGLGTVGNSLINYLLQLGIEKFILIDGDEVEERNLYHQHFFDVADVGKKKTEVVAKKLSQYSTSIYTSTEYFTDINFLNDLMDQFGIAVSSIFCCFDGDNARQLEKIFDFSVLHNVSVYISSYTQSSSSAQRLSLDIIKKIENDYRTYSETITDNSGIGLMGDIAAQQMVRIWLQDIVPELNISADILELDFLNYTSSQFDMDIFSTVDNLDFKASNSYIERYILPEYIDEVYKSYLQKGDESMLEIFDILENKFSIKLDVEEEQLGSEYVQKLRNLTFNFEDDEINVVEFAELCLSGESIPIEYKNRNIELLKSLETDVNKLLKIKKEKYYNNYLATWSKNEQFKPIFERLSDFFSDIYFDGEKDFEKYQNYQSSLGLSVSKQLETLVLIDEEIPEFRMKEYIRFLIKHDFINFSTDTPRSFHFYSNERKTSELFIRYSDDLFGLLNLAHEIGHAYFSSKISNSNLITKIPKEVDELFATIMEFIVIRVTRKHHPNFKIDKELFEILYKNVVISYSIDIYEEDLMRMEEDTYNWENIINIRRKGMDSSIKNIEYSDYNLALNTELLIEERIPYLSLKSYLYAFVISEKILDKPEYFYKLIEYLDETRSITMDDILMLFGISEKIIDINNIVDEFVNFIITLKNSYTGGVG